MANNQLWTGEELLLAFRLYCHTPFGKLHQHNPEIISLAAIIGRTPSAVAMKACNFASLDPQHQSRGIVALGNVSNADKALWEEFTASPDTIAASAEAAYETAVSRQSQTPTTAQSISSEPEINELLASLGQTEREQVVRVRRLQRFFRDSVMISYEYRCALSGLCIPALLNASHIVPWSADANRRADPRNGICLNVLYDRAFDRGLITIDDTMRVIVSPTIIQDDAPPLHKDYLIQLAGKPLKLPLRFLPDSSALEWHRTNVFKSAA